MGFRGPKTGASLPLSVLPFQERGKPGCVALRQQRNEKLRTSLRLTPRVMTENVAVGRRDTSASGKATQAASPPDPIPDGQR